MYKHFFFLNMLFSWYRLRVVSGRYCMATPLAPGWWHPYLLKPTNQRRVALQFQPQTNHGDNSAIVRLGATLFGSWAEDKPKEGKHYHPCLCSPQQISRVWRARNWWGPNWRGWSWTAPIMIVSYRNLIWFNTSAMLNFMHLTLFMSQREKSKCKK